MRWKCGVLLSAGDVEYWIFIDCPWAVLEFLDGYWTVRSGNIYKSWANSKPSIQHAFHAWAGGCTGSALPRVRSDEMVFQYSVHWHYSAVCILTEHAQVSTGGVCTGSGHRGSCTTLYCMIHLRRPD